MNLSRMIKDSSLVDLSWLRSRDTVLPKQNLDTVPDLQVLWGLEDGPSERLVPNRGEPKTMGDLSTAHGKLRSSPEATIREVVRTARLAVMRTANSQEIRTALLSHHDTTSLLLAKNEVLQTLAERGLLGRLYIAAEDFPNCANRSANEIDFVHRFASTSRYLVAKTACQDCCHKHNNHCGVFHKQLVLDVPYTPALAESVEQSRGVRGSAEADPKTRIRNAFLPTPPSAPPRTSFPKVVEGSALISPDRLIRKDLPRLTPVVRVASQLVNTGMQGNALLSSLQTKFLPAELKAEAVALRELLASGQGRTFIDPTVYDDYGSCRTAARQFRAKTEVVRVKQGPKCASCVHRATGTDLCSVLNKRISADPPRPEPVLVQKVASGASAPPSIVKEYGLTQKPITITAEKDSCVSSASIQIGRQNL
jgi:hypothetical protein